MLHCTCHLLITEKFPGSDFSLRLLYVKSRISNPEAVPKPLGRELSRFTLENTKTGYGIRLIDGGLVASGLVCSTLDQTPRVQALVVDIVLCF